MTPKESETFCCYTFAVSAEPTSYESLDLIHDDFDQVITDIVVCCFLTQKLEFFFSFLLFNYCCAEQMNRMGSFSLHSSFPGSIVSVLRDIHRWSSDKILLAFQQFLNHLRTSPFYLPFLFVCLLLQPSWGLQLVEFKTQLVLLAQANRMPLL